MPHLPPEPTTFEFGRQWRADADWPESQTHTSTPWTAGRGFADDPAHGYRLAEESEVLTARLLASLKAQGVAGVRTARQR